MLTVDRRSEALDFERTVIIGVGGGAGRITDLLGQNWSGGPTVGLVDSDSAALAKCGATAKLQIGRQVARGSGTGGDAQVGRRALQEDEELLQGLIEGRDLVILVVCLGGGLGTGAAPRIMERIRESGAVSLCFATLPFGFEGAHRAAMAEAGLRALHSLADAMIVMPNDRLVEKLGDRAGLPTAFQESDRLITGGVRTLCTMSASRGSVVLDFGDLRKLVQQSTGTCSFGYGEGMGPDRVAAALNDIQSCPLLLSDSVLADAQSITVGLMVGPDTTLVQTTEFMDAFSKSLNSRAHLAVGLATDPRWEDQFSVVVLAAESWGAGGPDPHQEEFSLDGAASALLQSQPKRRKRKTRSTQAKLRLDVTGKGRFKNVEPTVLDGEDLDIPTFVRRGIVIER